MRLDGFYPTSDLGEWGGFFDTLNPEDAFPISKAEYDRIKTLDWTAYRYNVGYEGMVVIVFDRDAKRVIELVRGSN